MKRIITLITIFISINCFAQDVLMQNGTVSQCSGSFLDSGGASNYSSNEDFVLTICSPTPGEAVVLDFITFGTQGGSDIMTIYDGDDTTAPVIGSYSGGGATNFPGTIVTSTANTSGCLTIHFVSDGGGNTIGWEAAIECVVPCQDITASIDSTDPVATAGVIAVLPGEVVTFNGSGTFSGDSTNATYTWDFGDGTPTETGLNVTHAYGVAGSYTVTFTVDDDNTLDCADTDTITINVLNSDVCIAAQPICSDIVNVPSQTGPNNAEAGIDYGCLGSQPDPIWYFLQTGDVAGDLDFTLTQFDGPNQTGGGNDVDFIIWGPFTEPQCGASNLNSTTQVDCSFSGSATEQIFVPNAPANSFYMLLVTNYSQDDGYINLVPNPGSIDTNCDIICQVDLGDDQSICSGDSYTITPSFNGAFNTFEWQLDGVTIPGETSSTITVNQSGTYTLLADGTDAAFGDPCSAQDDIVISFQDDFTASVTPVSATVCTGGDAVFTITGDATNIVDYNINGGGTLQTTLDASGESTITVTGVTTDQVITLESVSDASASCSAPLTESATVTIGTSPSVTLSSNNVTCSGGDAIFTITGDSGNIVDYNINSGATEQVTIDGTGEGIVTITNVTTDQTITLITVTNPTTSCSSTLTDTNTVTIEADPVITGLTTNTDICSGDDAIFTISGTPNDIIDYNINGGATEQVTVDASGNAIVTLTGVTANQTITLEQITSAATSCTAPLADTDTVIVNPSPTATVASNTDICSGDDAIFTITGTTASVVNYNINGGGTLQTTLDASGESIITIIGATTNQVLTLESIVDSSTTCNAILTESTTVVVNPNPTVVLSSNTAVCNGDDAVFTISGDAGDIVDYNINSGATEQVAIDATGEAIVTIIGVTSSQTITLESVINPTTSCSSILSDTNTVTIEPSPFVTGLTTNTDICSGDDAIFTITGTPNDIIDYNINGGATEQVTVDASGDAIVTIIGAVANQIITLEQVTSATTSCSSVLTDTATIIVNPNPMATVTSNIAICPGDDAVFTISGVAGDTVDYNINGGATTQTVLDASGESIITVFAPAVDQELQLEEVLDSNTSCVGVLTESDTVVVNPLPTVVTPTPLEVCDDATPDGITAIDLTLKNQEISGGNPAYTVSYYFTPLDAINATNPLAIPYTNQTPNMQTVYVRVEDANTGCFDTTSLELVVEQAPVAFTPAALEYCDPDSDGFGEFMLSDTEAEITAGAPGLTVTYHETMADAMNNVNALSSPYNNIVANMQTIYVRVESSTIATDCASFVELVLIVNPTPQITDPTALEVCDDDADGFATFNLPSKDAEILNLLDTDPTNDLDPTQYTVTYYITPGDAMAGTNPIATPNAYVNTSNPQIVHVRVEDTANDCFTNTTLELIVNPLPVLVQPDPLALCDVNNPGDEVEAFTLEDANAQILNGQTGITLTYFDTQAGADTNDAAAQIFSPYTNTVNPQTVYVRAENDNTGCVSTITLDLRVNPLPSPVAMPAAIEECDDDNDGFASFDLDAQSAIITNGEPDITISYYETQDDAMNMVNPLVSPYNNIVANIQTIYVLAENDNTGCFTIVEMPLIVQPAPVVPLDIEDYIICDDDDDGFNQFDFDAVITPQIFTAGQTVADFTLTYHTTQANADSGNNPIINTSNYTNNSNPQTIYIRLESNTNGCVTTGEFIIRVEFPPVLDPNYDNELAQCDDLDANYMEANDGFTSFDLTVEDSEIVNGNNSWVVTYYETMADAQGDVNAIADPTNYTNTMNGPQTLYVRVTDNDTGCFSFTTVTLRVLPNPSPTPDPEDLIVCDDTNAGDLIEVFDLTQNEIAIINGELNVTASYYTSQDDAITGNNAIADPTMHTNEDPNNPGTGITPQTIYVRLTNGDDNTGLNGTGCYSLVSFDVIVNPLPTVTPVDDYIICELFNDGMADFDLDGTMTAAILNGQDPSIFTVSYHETQAEADAAINGLNSPYTNITNPQTIYVNITNTITGCDVATLNFNIEVQEAAQANPDGVAIVYEQCDDNMEFDGDPSNDTVQFNLETQNPFVLDGQDANNYTVSYYENQADADAGTNPLPFLYENTSNPQVIIVRVDNDTMIVTPISLDLSSLTTGLDVDSDGNIDTIDTNGDGVFDIVDINGDGIAEGFDSDADGIIDYIDLDGDGNGDLVDLNNDGVVDNGQDSSICYETAEVTLQVNPLPAFDLDDSYLLCINTNGTEVVNSPLVDTGLDASLYSFEWSYEGNVMAGETGPSIMPTEGGNYSVIVTDTSTSANTMCMSSDSTVVDVSEPPVISYELLTAAFADQHDVQVTASGSTATSIAVYEFSLNGGAWQLGTANADGSYSHTFTNIPAGGIVVTARDVNGCGEVSEEIMVLDYPVYFTPNGDGYNETWNIYSISNYPDAKIYIFDRFGKLLKQISPLGDGWNGTYNGNPMPTSDYWFTVEYTDTATNTKKHFRAHFTLKR
ncbi:T9SS type B sorting domain-containing protein [Lacinutrix sp. 5H-3-7-4]|uniref:T9SS type B sorting domain-containing protein n=1 Tax=Lacinutrix sp. (strain 5H-3-7-4) TaxID=983544 RepID=UPI0002114ED5|nr:T9SS type B sorting domain-containing protein [Lacinutrix sp. 5H-3-7-4]AEH00200.1 PKD domain containing protein [Lacinutrix sp. 5H-3-7-4]